MKVGRSIQAISSQIVATHQAKRDYVMSTNALAVGLTDDRKDINLTFTVKGEKRVYKPTSLCFEQMADRVGIPRKYADRMRTEAPELLARNLNHWFTEKPEKRMVRTLNNDQNVARAFLSERYRPLDNYDLAHIVLPKLQEAGCEVHSSEITEQRFYIQASTPKITSIIEQNVKLGTHNRIQRTVQAGVIIGNSEVGCGSIFIEPIMYDLVCTNGLILQRTLRRNHVGRRNEGEIAGDDASFELFSDETRKLDDKAFWAKVSDVMVASLDKIKFDENINRLKDAQTQVLIDGKPKEIDAVVEIVSERYNFNEEEKGSLLLHFAQGGDFSKYGLINAVTRTAEDVTSYDRAVELERLGGQIIELPKSDFMPN